MKYLWLVIFVIVLGFLFFYGTRTHKVIVNGKTFNVEIAQTDAERNKGLSGRDSLAVDAGMLFVFPSSDIWPFWMKETMIPLDIIFINDNRVVEMTTLDIPSGDDVPSYTPTQKAQYVLELNANSGFKVGEEVEIKI